MFTTIVLSAFAERVTALCAASRCVAPETLAVRTACTYLALTWRVRQALAALTSERGSSLVTLAIGVACRSSVEALAAAQQRSEAAAAAAGRPDLPERLMRFAGAPRQLQLPMCTTARMRPQTAGALACRVVPGLTLSVHALRHCSTVLLGRHGRARLQARRRGAASPTRAWQRLCGRARVRTWTASRA